MRPETFGIIVVAFLFVLTIPFYFSMDSGSGILSDINLSFLDLNDTPNTYAGQSLKVVQVNPGETGLQFASVSGVDTNCDKNPNCTITGTINTGFDGNYNDMNVDGNISLLEGKGIKFGRPIDWNINQDGANLRLYQLAGGSGFFDINASNLRAQHIGINNTSPGPNFVINAGIGAETIARGILVGQLVYMGTLAPTAVNFGMDYNGNAPMIVGGATLYGRFQHVDNTSNRSWGVQAECGFTPLKNIKFTTGTYECASFQSMTQGADANTQISGGAWPTFWGFRQTINEDLNGRGVSFGSVWNNDVQIKEDANLFFDGVNDYNKGNTGFNYSSTSNDLNFFVDNNTTGIFDNDDVNWYTRHYFQQDINAKKNLYVDQNIYGQLISPGTAVGTSCNTVCGAVQYSGPWVCVEAIDQTGVLSTCSDITLAKTCLCQN